MCKQGNGRCLFFLFSLTLSSHPSFQMSMVRTDKPIKLKNNIGKDVFIEGTWRRLPLLPLLTGQSPVGGSLYNNLGPGAEGWRRPFWDRTMLEGGLSELGVGVRKTSKAEWLASAIISYGLKYPGGKYVVSISTFSLTPDWKKFSLKSLTLTLSLCSWGAASIFGQMYPAYQGKMTAHSPLKFLSSYHCFGKGKV